LHPVYIIFSFFELEVVTVFQAADSEIPGARYLLHMNVASRISGTGLSNFAGQILELPVSVNQQVESEGQTSA
jgi:hypothetical protein